MRRAGVVAVAGALALLSTGCGRGDDGQQVSTTKEIDVAQSVADAGTFRATFSVSADAMGEGDDGGPSGSFVLTGVVDPAAGAYDLEGRAELTTEPAQGSVDEPADDTTIVMAYRSDGTQSWARVGGVDAPWAELPAEAADALGSAADQVAPFIDPVTFMTELRDRVSEFTEVGTEDLDGTATTRYRAELGAETIDVWVDDQDRPRRIESAGGTLELTDYGVAVEIEAPEVTVDDPFGGLAGVLPQTTGAWEQVATGTVGDAAWEVWSVAAEAMGEPTRCLTFEIEGVEPFPPIDPDDVPGGFGGALEALPSRDGRLATCLESEDPALSTLDGSSFERVAPVALVVSERFADGPAVVVVDDGSEIDVPLSNGVGVFDPDGVTGLVTEVRLADGTVSCPVDTGRFTEPGQLPGVGACVGA